MKNKIVIGNWEAYWLLINAICAKLYLGYPRVTVETSGTAGWILSIYISLLALAGFAIISRLYSRFEGKDLLDLGEYVLGTAGRIIVGLTLLSFLLFIVPAVLRIFTEDMKIISLPTSPISYVTMFFLAGMVTAAYFGIETIARMSGLIVVIVAVAYLTIVFAVIPYYDVTNILPILGNGLDTIILKGSLKVSAFSELVYLFILIPFLRTNRNFRKVGYWVIISSGIYFVIGSLTYLFTLPYPTGLERILPIYQMTRLINYGRFFQRIESVFLLSWASAALMYISSGFFFIIYIFKKTFRLEYERPLILPFTIVVFVLSLLPPNLLNTVNLEASIFRNWSWMVTFGMTIILLVIARFIRIVP